MIRPAGVADIAGIYAAHQSSVRQLCGNEYTPQQIAMWLDGRTPVMYLDAIEKQLLWVAVNQTGDIVGDIVGFIEVEGNEISKMFVAGAAAFQGVGRQLMRTALAHIAASGVAASYLESTRTAVKFYEKHGFHVIGEGVFSRGNSTVQLEIVKMERQFFCDAAT